MKENELKAELKKQDSFLWQRGKYFQSYEEVLGTYMVRCVLENSRPPSLLDIACGNGFITSKLAINFKTAVGIDASSIHIATAKQTYPNIKFVRSLAEEYSTDVKFATISMLNLLEHVIDPVNLLCKIKSQLADKGVIIITVPNALAANRKIAALMGSLENEYELSPFDIDVAGHRRAYDLKRLVKEVEEAGLKVLKTGGIFYKMLSSAQMNWLLEKGLWEKGGFGWGRVGAEKSKDWRAAFCDALYKFGESHSEECNLIYVVSSLP